MAVDEPASPRLRRVAWAYGVAAAGPALASASYVAVLHRSIPLGVFAMVLLLCVLGAAVLGGPKPAAYAAGLSFMCLDLFDEPPVGWPTFTLQEIELLGGFIVVAAATIVVVHRGLAMREREVRSELRWDRLGRALEAVSAGVSGTQLVRIVERELVQELDLEMARYEPEPRTTCVYRIGRHGGLDHHGDRLQGLQLRLPDEPVGVPMRFRGDDLGQLVLIPTRAGPITEDQLLLTANLASVLAEALQEDSSVPVPGARTHVLRQDHEEEH